MTAQTEATRAGRCSAAIPSRLLLSALALACHLFAVEGIVRAESSKGLQLVAQSIKQTLSQCVSVACDYRTTTFFPMDRVVAGPFEDGTVEVTDTRARINGEHARRRAAFHPDYAQPYTETAMPVEAHLLGRNAHLSITFPNGEILSCWTDGSEQRLTSVNLTSSQAVHGIRIPGNGRFELTAFRPDQHLLSLLTELRTGDWRATGTQGDSGLVEFRKIEGEIERLLTADAETGFVLSSTLFRAGAPREAWYFSGPVRVGDAWYPGFIRVEEYGPDGVVTSLREWEEMEMTAKSSAECDEGFSAELPEAATSTNLPASLRAYSR